MQDGTQLSEKTGETAWWRWALSIAGLSVLLAYLYMSQFDDVTELFPYHPDAMNWCVAFGVFGALAAVALVWAHWKKLPLIYKIAIAPLSPFLGFVFLFGPSSTAMNIIENQRDFPPTQTTTFDGLLAISRAYQTHGKGNHWNIQTMPLWSDMSISETDYNFMLKNPAPEQDTTNKDEIRSKGFFCARVTMQRTAKALRVLHAGTNKLPEGTVTICPH